MPGAELIQVEHPRDGVVLLRLNRPDRRNALSTELREEGCRLLARLADDESVRALVVTGSGPHFCSGFDLAEFETALTDEAFEERLWASSDEWHQRWLTFPVPTIAAVGGAALAGGFDLAVLCDLRVVAGDATFAHPEISFGDVVYGPLHDLIGGAVARDLCFTGRRIDAEVAARLGLVSRLVEPDQLLDAALDLAGDIARLPRATLMRTKQKAIRRGANTDTATLDL